MHRRCHRMSPRLYEVYASSCPDFRSPASRLPAPSSPCSFSQLCAPLPFLPSFPPLSSSSPLRFLSSSLLFLSSSLLFLPSPLLPLPLPSLPSSFPLLFLRVHIPLSPEVAFHWKRTAREAVRAQFREPWKRCRRARAAPAKRQQRTPPSAPEFRVSYLVT